MGSVGLIELRLSLGQGFVEKTSWSGIETPGSAKRCTESGEFVFQSSLAGRGLAPSWGISVFVLVRSEAVLVIAIDFDFDFDFEHEHEHEHEAAGRRFCAEAGLVKFFTNSRCDRFSGGSCFAQNAASGPCRG